MEEGKRIAPCPHQQAAGLARGCAAGGAEDKLWAPCAPSPSKSPHRDVALPHDLRAATHGDADSVADTCSTHDAGEDDEHARHLGFDFDRLPSDGFERTLSPDDGYEMMPGSPAGSEQHSEVGEAYSPDGLEPRPSEERATVQVCADDAAATHEPKAQEGGQRGPDAEPCLAEVTTQCGKESPAVELPARQRSDRGQRAAVGEARTERVCTPVSGEYQELAEAAPLSSEGSAQADCSIAEQPLAPLRALPFQLRCKQGPPEASKLGQGLRVAIVMNGSLGDIKPVVALSRHLMQFRHRVQVMTAVNLVDLCVEHGVDAVPVFADMQAVMTRIGGMASGCLWAESFGRGLKASKEWLAENKGSWIPPEVALADYQPEAILAGPQSMGVAGRYEAENLVPVLPVFFSQWAYEIFEDFTQIKPARPALLASNSHLDVRLKRRVPTLHQTGEWVLYDVPSTSDLTGGGRLVELRRFLGRGPAPVAVGWGSMLAFGMTPMAMTLLALRALKAAGRRGVIVGGWAELNKFAGQLSGGSHEGLDSSEAADLAAFAAREVCFVDAAPHEWLFPQCCAVVHHGGSGTWHTAARAGTPAVVTPIFGDQFGHGAWSDYLGVSVSFDRPLPEIGPTELAEAIRSAEGKAAAAEALGSRMRGQVGERAGAEVIDTFLQQQVRTGKWARAKKALTMKPKKPLAARSRQ